VSWTSPRTLWLLLAALVASFALRAGEMRAQPSRASSEWKELSHCLFGGPLTEGELPSTRLRNIALAAMSQAASKHFEEWPASCREPATAMIDALESEGKKSTALGRIVRDLPESLERKPSEFIAQFVWFDALVAAAEAEGLPPAGTSGAHQPPAAPATPLRSGDLPPFTPGTHGLLSARTDAAAGPSPLVVFGDKPWPRACRFAALPEPLATARCHDLPAAIPAYEPHPRNSSEPGEKALVTAGYFLPTDTWDAEQGAPLDATMSLAGRLRDDGTVVVVHRPDARKLVVVRRAGTARVESTIDVDASVKTAEMIGEVLVWWQGSDEAVKLLALSIPAGDAPLGAPTALDGVRYGSLTGCTSGATTVVVSKGKDGKASVVFGTGDRWSAPVQADARFQHVTCRGEEAWLTGAWRFGTSLDVFGVHCTPASCKTTSTEVGAFRSVSLGDSRGDYFNPDAIDAVDLGGKMLVVWNGGSYEGVRMRLAPAAEIDRASDVVLVDYGYSLWNVPSVGNLSLVGVPGAAVLLLDAKPIRALRIDANGSVTPLVAAEGPL
jgi:hypothetical protein